MINTNRIQLAIVKFGVEYLAAMLGVIFIAWSYYITKHADLSQEWGLLIVSSSFFLAFVPVVVAGASMNRVAKLILGELVESGKSKRVQPRTMTEFLITFSLAEGIVFVGILFLVVGGPYSIAKWMTPWHYGILTLGLIISTGMALVAAVGWRETISGKLPSKEITWTTRITVGEFLGIGKELRSQVPGVGTWIKAYISSATQLTIVSAGFALVVALVRYPANQWPRVMLLSSVCPALMLVLRRIMVRIVNLLANRRRITEREAVVVRRGMVRRATSVIGFWLLYWIMFAPGAIECALVFVIVLRRGVVASLVVTGLFILFGSVRFALGCDRLTIGS